jgi:hypothetical protein
VPFVVTLKTRIGEDVFSRLEKIAEKEVALAVQMPLKDKYGQDLFYQSFVLGELLNECERFESAKLRISPPEVIKVFFRSKLLFACKSEPEYRQRCGGFHNIGDFRIDWRERAEGADALVEKYGTRLEEQVRERILLSHASAFTTIEGDPTTLRQFFDELFAALHFPFVCFPDDDLLLREHQELEPGLNSYDQASAKRFFSAPSIGFKIAGTHDYCFWYSVMWLRAFLNLLRIAAFIHPGQRSFGWDARMTGPTYPVFLGDHSMGAMIWDQDEKQSWAKIPDGCLFLSFGYRGLSNMWLDRRTFPGIRKFVTEHKPVLSALENPWRDKCINDIAPTLDVLSSATQIPDLGAKILLIYCCLEHLFGSEKRLHREQEVHHRRHKRARSTVASLV